MAHDGTMQLTGQTQPDNAAVGKGRLYWDPVLLVFFQIDQNGLKKNLTTENPAGLNGEFQ